MKLTFLQLISTPISAFYRINSRSLLKGLQEAWNDITPPAKKSLLIENPLTEQYQPLEGSEGPLSDWFNSIFQRCQKPARGAQH